MTDKQLLAAFIEASRILCTANLYAVPDGQSTLQNANRHLLCQFDKEVLQQGSISTAQRRADWLSRNNLAVIGNGLYAPRGRK